MTSHGTMEGFPLDNNIYVKLGEAIAKWKTKKEYNKEGIPFNIEWVQKSIESDLLYLAKKMDNSVGIYLKSLGRGVELKASDWLFINHERIVFLIPKDEFEKMRKDGKYKMMNISNKSEMYLQ